MNCFPATLQSTTGQKMALEGVTAHGIVRGLLFELTVEQRYRNPTSTNIEVVYTFPLPSEATLLDLDIELGERKLTAAVVEKKEAEIQYEQAIDSGDTAIMLERAGDGLCALNLGNLMAGETATIRYRYAQLLRFEHGSVRLAIPTVIAPRYGDPSDSGLAPHQIPVTDMRVEYPLALTLELHGEVARGKLSSPSHSIATESLEDGVRVSLARGAFLDRDFVLNVGGLQGRSLAVVGRDGDHFAVLASFCAEVDAETPPLPVQVKLLVDCSGSMAGDSIEAARRALLRILGGLQPVDRFSLSRFGSTVVHETAALGSAGGPHLGVAIEKVKQMQADLGGTEMAAALSATIQHGGADNRADVLLITDGEIWDEYLVNEALAARLRVFVVGIGSAPAEGVLKRLADASGGACEFVAPNEDVEGAVLRMFARLRAHRIENSSIRWPSPPQWETPRPNGLFHGETIHAFAGFDCLPAGETTLTLQPADKARSVCTTFHLPTDVLEDRTLARVAAALRLPAARPRQQLQLALDYGLLTDRTNLLVVHQRAEGEKANNLPELARVAQMHAAGWHGLGSVSPTSYFVGDSCRSESFARSSKLYAGSPLGLRRSRGVTAGSTPFVSVPPPHVAKDSSLVALLRSLAQSKPKSLPTSLADLTSLGLPLPLLAWAKSLVVGGHAEQDVVRALLESLGELAASGKSSVKFSRQLLRALRRQFAQPDDCGELRRLVRKHFVAAFPQLAGTH